MRTFVLYDSKLEKSFRLDLPECIVEEVNGLGNTFNLQSYEGDVEITSNYSVKFDDIELTIYFGYNSNPYAKFSELMNFILQNGKNNLVLFYNDGIKTRQADVWIKNAPKTQKNEYGVIKSKFIFKRTSFWYTTKVIEFHNTTECSVDINNSFIEDIPVNILITGISESFPLFIDILNEYNAGVVRIELNLDDDGTQYNQVLIDSKNKKINLLKDGIVKGNAYNCLDFSFDSFPIVPAGGKYKLKINIGTYDYDIEPTNKDITISYDERMFD